MVASTGETGSANACHPAWVPLTVKISLEVSKAVEEAGGEEVRP